MGFGRSSSPTTVRKPEKFNSKGSVAVSLLRMPTSTFSAPGENSTVTDQAFSVIWPDNGSRRAAGGEDQCEVKVRVLDMLS